MCVPNTTSRRPNPVAFQQQQLSWSQNVLSQQLFGGYLPNQTFEQAVNKRAESQIPSKFVSTVTNSEKQRPKRRRKPQKPGKTAKNHDRHFVVHNYHDHALDTDDVDCHETSEDAHLRRRGGVSIAFPLKLHSVLDQVEADGLGHIVSWQGHGRAFMIHNPKEFVDHVMPRYFRQSKLTSFQRQLNLYGFARLTRGPDAGGYYHELFLRGKEFLCKHMIRTKVKGTMFKAASSPEHEPDFYQMPAVVVSPRNSDDEYANSPEYEVSNCNFDSTSSNIDPMSFQFAQQLPCEPPKLYYAQSPVVSQPTPSLPYSYGCGISIASDTDRILDEAVDELFLHQEDVDTLDEFVHDWDPSFEESSGFGSSIDDDSQLGYLLEKLLQG